MKRGTRRSRSSASCGTRIGCSARARRSQRPRRSWRSPSRRSTRNQFGGMKADEAKRLKGLERENARLKAIVADQALENRALKEIAKGNW